MKKVFIGVLSLLLLVFNPIVVFAEPTMDQGEFIVQPQGGSLFVDNDYFVYVQNKDYYIGTTPDTKKINLTGYQVELKTELDTYVPIGEPIQELHPTEIGNSQSSAGEEPVYPYTLEPGIYNEVVVPYSLGYAGKTKTFRVVAVFTDSEAGNDYTVNSNDFEVTWKEKRILSKISPLEDVADIQNGVDKTAEALKLPQAAELIFADSTTGTANIEWNVASCSYDKTNLAEQTFNVSGSVVLPEDVDPNGASLTVTVKVTVKKADQVAAPVLSLEAGTYTESKTVTIDCSTQDAVIYYTLDGTIPTKSSLKYTGAIQLSGVEGSSKTYLLNAIATKDGMNNSEVVGKEYIINIPKEFLITISNDGNGTASANVQKAVAGTKVTLTAQPNSGYIFKSWDNSGTTVTIKDNSFTMPEGDVSLKATFSKQQTFTVTFVSSRSSVPSPQSVLEGNKVSQPSKPSATGYKFEGWYTDATCRALYDFNSKVTKSFSLYAKWTQEKTYTVTFSMGGRGSAINPKTVKEGERISRPSDPTAQGYKFEGWYKDSSYREEFNFSEPITKNTTIYAKWSGTNSSSQSSTNRSLPSGTKMTSMSKTTTTTATNGKTTPNFVYQQVLPEGTVMCTCNGKTNEFVDLKAYGTDPLNIANQQILASAFMDQIFGMDAACYKTVDLYPVMPLNETNNGSLQMLRWVNTNYPAGAVFGVVYNLVDKAYIIPGVCDTKGTVTLSNFVLRSQSTLTLIVPMKKVTTTPVTSSPKAAPNGVTKVETTTTTVETTSTSTGTNVTEITNKTESSPNSQNKSENKSEEEKKPVNNSTNVTPKTDKDKKKTQMLVNVP